MKGVFTVGFGSFSSSSTSSLPSGEDWFGRELGQRMILSIAPSRRLKPVRMKRIGFRGTGRPEAE
jgi:hypothetical protein